MWAYKSIDLITHALCSGAEVCSEIYNNEEIFVRWFLCIYLSIYLVLTPDTGLFVLTQIFQYEVVTCRWNAVCYTTETLKTKSCWVRQTIYLGNSKDIQRS
jgi:hypothetical protein